MDPAIILSIVSTAVSAGGAMFGVITHSKNQTLKRQEIIIPLIKEFDTDDRLGIARRLLEGIPVVVEDREYGVDELPTVLRVLDPREERLTPTELKIRYSFVGLIDFFCKLGYLMEIGVITRKDLGYFDYYIYKARDNSAINTYTEKYKFGLELYGVLLDKMNLMPPILKELPTEYYRRNKKSTFRW